MPDYTVILTGSRTWTDHIELAAQLDAQIDAAVAAGADRLVLRHGACYPDPEGPEQRIPARSADWLGHLWATLRPHRIPVVEEAEPADWVGPCRPSCQHGPRRVRRGRSICQAAGAYRNADMVGRGADAGVALIRNGSSGATGCLRLMRAAGIPVEPVQR